MKKVLFSVLFVGVAAFANAQKSEVAEAKRLWNIYQLQRQGGAKNPVDKQITSLKEGLSHADKAIVHEKTKELAEPWAYKALFTSQIAYVDTLNLANSQAMQKDAETALAKLTSLDTKNEEKDNVETVKNNLRNTVTARGVRAYNAKDYSSAYDSFMQALVLNPSDTAMYMNAGLVAKMAKKYPEAIENFKKMISFNGKDAKSYFVEIVNIQLDSQKDTVAGLATLGEALTKFPNDAEFVGVQTDIYIKRGDIAKSQESLKILIEKDPKRAVYQHLMGDTYYKQALALQDQRAKIDQKKVKEFDAVTAKMVAFIDQALPYYKKAIEIDPKYVSSLETLKQLYAFKNDTKNYDDIKKRLDALPAN